MQYLEHRLDGKTIRGFLEGDSHTDVVVFVHGFTGNKTDHHFMMRTFARQVVTLGYSAYRFDFFGSGDSDGTFEADESILYQIQQLQRIIDSFKQKGYRVHVFAYSLGGVIATHCSQYDSLFLLSPAGNFKEILMQFQKMGKPYRDGFEVNGFYVRSKFIEEANTFAYYQFQMKNCPSYLVQGTNDQYVSYDSFETYRKQLNCSFQWIEGADHCFTTIEYTEQVLKEIRFFYGKIKEETN